MQEGLAPWRLTSAFPWIRETFSQSCCPLSLPHSPYLSPLSLSLSPLFIPLSPLFSPYLSPPLSHTITLSLTLSLTLSPCLSDVIDSTQPVGAHLGSCIHPSHISTEPL